MRSSTFRIEEMIVARLETGDDVLLGIKRVAEEQEVSTGLFTLIGAVDRARWGFYNPSKRIYQVETWRPGALGPRALEILSCMGNIAKLDDETVVHGHITFKGFRQPTVGGHLMEGCRVNPTAELSIIKGSGVLGRRRNPELNLALLDL